MRKDVGEEGCELVESRKGESKVMDMGSVNSEGIQVPCVELSSFCEPEI